MPTNRDIKSQIDAYMKKAFKGIENFEKKDKRQILRKAAAPVRKTARTLTLKRSGTGKIGLRPNPRYPTKGKHVKRAKKGQGKPVAYYHAGNLRRSIKTITFRRSENIFVGPKYARSKYVDNKEIRGKYFGRPGQPVDGYYAAMAYGSARSFSSRVLLPALSQNKALVSSIIIKESKTKIVQRIRRGL